MAATTYTVKKGDTLTAIARNHGTTIAKLVELNDITDPNYIVVGQVLKLTGDPEPDVPYVASRATIKAFGLQSNTSRTVYATWTWDRDNTAEYKVKWYYYTEDNDGVAFVGTDSTVTVKQSVYNAPSNATKVKFIVKPVSKTKKVNDKDVHYWSADWSSGEVYNFSNNPPEAPSAPSVEIKNYTLTAELNNLNVNGTVIQFQVVKDNSTVFKTGKVTIKTNYASFSCTVDAGSEYKVRCRALRGAEIGDWSEFTDNVGTAPSAPTSIIKCQAKSETSVYLEWNAVKTAETYDIEYTTKKEYFDGSDQTSTESGVEFTHYEKTGLTSGEEYFFRVRAVNESGASSWSEIKSVAIGTDPAAPTTWSSTTTVVVGEPLNLYWVHNTEDGSSQTFAQLELSIGGKTNIYTIENIKPEDKKDEASIYSIDTSEYSEGTKILWRVKTRGVTATYSEWSVQRTVDIYAPPSLTLVVTDSTDNALETLTSFPIHISAAASPNTQKPISYHLTVTANDSYETVDQIGNTKMVSSGEQVYSNVFDISTDLSVDISANNIDLENNIGYTITCSVSMNSGLTATASMEFDVAWSDEVYEPDAEIGIDPDTLAAYIGPYCMDRYGRMVDNVTLAVYRREYDGGFTEIATGLDNSKNTYVTDPHPALDYARYRIVATSTDTGAVSYYDVPGYPVGEKAVILQWAEEWSNFDSSENDVLEQPVWSGSLLKLPYNIDVSDSHKMDVALIEYIGRKHPVSYYGTQLGISSTWNVEIVKSDEETLYALRRLAIWPGDVYVREPSGSGYWANVEVSFSQKHCELTIPVTLNITRVAGGI